MSSDFYTSLSWLPKPPDDFATSCKALAAESQPGAPIRHLAGHGLHENQLSRLGRAIMRLADQGQNLSPLVPFRLGLIGNGTLDFLAPVIVGTAARYGFALHCIQGDYDQILQEALRPDGNINAGRPDAVLLAIDYRALPLSLTAGDPGAEQADIGSAMRMLETIRTGIRTNCGAICIVQNLAPPPETLFGSFDRLVPGTPRRVIDGINHAIADSIAGTPDVLLDVAALAETIGLGTWHSPPQWNMAKLAFADVCLPLYADHVCRLIAALRGKSRRCLVLDLDNTIWGGVIGDDGIDGIKVAQGDATGEAHLSIQLMARRLRDRGIVLAVCSKNTDEIARLPFRLHPEMLLKEDSFTVFQANWNDKATNIQAIAEELSLGLESLVFLDDNPMERDLVRRMLPQVAVPELPDDPAWYARLLAAAGYFESIAFSGEDRGRADMYQSNARRAALLSQAGDLDAYLASLRMEIVFAPFDRTGRARIAQLINKSNQFNLTTQRYSETEVGAAEDDPQVFTLQVRLLDAFGDNGMISVVICRQQEPRAWMIDTWLMSCRVLGRKVEQMVLREILCHARARGVERLVGRYRPTERNALVADHYEKLGFRKISHDDDGSTTWNLAVDSEISGAPMSVRRVGFAPPAD